MLNRLSSRIGVALVVLLFASTASAVSTYTEVLDYDDLGYVSVGNPLDYDHTFGPANLGTGDPVSVSKVKLAILLTEDLECSRWVQCRYDIRSEGEWAVITVEGDEIYDGQIHFANLVVRDVTVLANITAVGDTFEVSIGSDGGDFLALYSVAEFTYDIGTAGGSGGTGTTPMPEPSAAMAFGVGLLVLSRRLRT